MRNQRGFTIVELLIVIVVNAILAAITVVAYNGIQQRAKNSSVESTVSNFRKALASYASVNQKYPIIAADGTRSSSCLGPASQFTTASTVCYGATANSANTTAMETGLQTVLSTIPSPNTDCYTMYGGCRKNMTFIDANDGTWKIDDVAYRYFLIYFLDGNAKCAQTNTLGENASHLYPSFISTNTNGYTERDGTVSMCVVKLPLPA